MNEITSPENHRHYPGLDGLRAVAVLMVLFQHYVQVPPEALWGWSGVRIFFALSGFLITGILYDTRHAERRWTVFYARRALRIFPLYYGVLIVAAVAYPIARWRLHTSYWLWPVYLQNFARYIWPAHAVLTSPFDNLYSTRFVAPLLRLRFGHFWSLAVEEQFYLVWPFVVFAVGRRETLMKICVGVMVATPLARLLLSYTLPRTWLEFGFQERFTFVQFDALLVGALCALWLRGPHPDLTQLAKGLLIALVLAFGLGEILCWRIYHELLTPSIGYPIFGSLGLTCVDLGGAALVLLAIDPRTWFSRIMEYPVLRHVGKVSYGFYIFHDMLHDVYSGVLGHLHVPDPRGITSCLVALICTLILANLSFRYYEKPFLQLKRFFQV